MTQGHRRLWRRVSRSSPIPAAGRVSRQEHRPGQKRYGVRSKTNSPRGNPEPPAAPGQAAHDPATTNLMFHGDILTTTSLASLWFPEHTRHTLALGLAASKDPLPGMLFPSLSGQESTQLLISMVYSIIPSSSTCPSNFPLPYFCHSLLHSLLLAQDL